MNVNVLLILPDFALILLGLALTRVFGYARDFWTGAEKLVYYVMFPALLFSSINAAEFSIVSEAKLLAAAVIALFVAIGLAAAARWLKPAPDVYASCVQTAFRYNSYIGLALAQSLFGAKGVALIALIFAVCVPLANTFAVLALARHRQTGVARELIRNPLIVSTLAGLASNLLGLQLPTLVGSFMGRLGAASIAIGLMCIGAGLTLQGARAQRLVLAYFSAVKLLLFPAVAMLVAYGLGLRGVEAQVVVLFAALPTASTAYVLAARMGGNASPVAVQITTQTLLSMLTLPLWIALAPA